MSIDLMSLATLLTQQGDGGDGIIAALFRTTYFFCCALPFYLLTVAGLWKMFVKAGRPGWPAIIPLYNLWVAFEISGHPGWWMLGLLIPFVNIIVAAVLFYHLALSFGKGLWTTLGLYFLSFITTLWLGFGDAEYIGPAGAPQAPPPPPPPYEPTYSPPPTYPPPVADMPPAEDMSPAADLPSTSFGPPPSEPEA